MDESEGSQATVGQTWMSCQAAFGWRRPAVMQQRPAWMRRSEDGDRAHDSRLGLVARCLLNFWTAWLLSSACVTVPFIAGRWGYDKALACELRG
jgi:hypothetical protein